MFKKFRYVILILAVGVGLFVAPNAMAHDNSGYCGSFWPCVTTIPGSPMPGNPQTVTARTPSGTETGRALIEGRQANSGSGAYYNVRLLGIQDWYADGSNYCVAVFAKFWGSGNQTKPAYFRYCNQGSAYSSHDMTYQHYHSPRYGGVDFAVCQAYQYYNNGWRWDHYNCSNAWYWGPNNDVQYDHKTDAELSNTTDFHRL